MASASVIPEHLRPAASRLRLADRVSLSKPVLSLWVAGAAFAAYLIPEPGLDLRAVAILTSMLLLSAAGATLNNLQDREIDSRFVRTCGRPLVTGTVTVQGALTQGVCLGLLALTGLAIATGGLTTPCLGLVGLVLYNVLYTPMKRATALSVVPGALAGAMPIAIGWVAAGGPLSSTAVWLLMAILVIWQLPHVWLQQLAQPDADRCQMLPSLLHRMSDGQMRRLILLCVVVLTGLTLLLPLCGLITNPAAVSLLLVHSACLLAVFVWAGHLRPSPSRYRSLFSYWNVVVAVLLVMVVLG
jgi:protoheme IX farnesyltransferase